jgi:hypothetical protein
VFSLRYESLTDFEFLLQIKINRLRWRGHVIRRENEEIIKRIMLVKPEGNRMKGRPRMRWHKNGMAGEHF